MSCSCKSEIEAKLLSYFKEAEPKATRHEVELQGYGLAMVGSNVKGMGYMNAQMVADYPSPGASVRRRRKQQKMAFSYCPFCGTKVEA
jgi:hypothetical protein